MTLDEVRNIMCFRSEITDEAMIFSLELIECGWILLPQVPVHSIVIDRLNRQRDELLPPPDEAEIATMLEAIQQDEEFPDHFSEVEVSFEDASAGSESTELPVENTGSADQADGDISPLFGRVTSTQPPLARRSSISSRSLGVAFIAIAVVVGAVFFYDHRSSIKAPSVETVGPMTPPVRPAVESGAAAVQPAVQEEKPQAVSQVEVSTVPKPAQQFTWKKSRERMLKRIRDRRGE